jgi:hypothetical protein
MLLALAVCLSQHAFGVETKGDGITAVRVNHVKRSASAPPSSLTALVTPPSARRAFPIRHLRMTPNEITSACKP